MSSVLLKKNLIPLFYWVSDYFACAIPVKMSNIYSTNGENHAI